MKYLIICLVAAFTVAACSPVEIIDPCSGKKFPAKQWCKFKDKVKG
jgi:hypothetical protein